MKIHRVTTTQIPDTPATSGDNVNACYYPYIGDPFPADDWRNRKTAPYVPYEPFRPYDPFKQPEPITDIDEYIRNLGITLGKPQIVSEYRIKDVENGKHYLMLVPGFSEDQITITLTDDVNLKIVTKREDHTFGREKLFTFKLAHNETITKTVLENGILTIETSIPVPIKNEKKIPIGLKGPELLSE